MFWIIFIEKKVPRNFLYAKQPIKPLLIRFKFEYYEIVLKNNLKTNSYQKGDIDG